MPTSLNGKGQSVQAGSTEGQGHSWPTSHPWEGTTRWIAWTHRAFLHYVSQMLFILLTRDGTRVVHIITMCESLGLRMHSNYKFSSVKLKQKIDNHGMILVRSLIWPHYSYSIAGLHCPCLMFAKQNQSTCSNIHYPYERYSTLMLRTCWVHILRQVLRCWLT